MACFKPLTAYRTAGGDITFRQGHGVGLSINIPCGQCIGCRLERSRQWAMRCVYESNLYPDNCFLTLTYSPEHVPAGGTLVKRHFQLFMKRLRRRYPAKTIRYFMCGEYGDQLQRPHYHALIFGFDFSDKMLFSDGGNPSYTSEILSVGDATHPPLWPHGFCTIGAVTFDSAAYVARYCLKKRTGKQAASHYERLDPSTGEIFSLQPEYINMSLKPAIGWGWYQAFQSDVFPSDFLIVNGHKVRPPKYFDKLLKRSDPNLLEQLKLRRVRRASRSRADTSSERLSVRERVVTARTVLFKSRHKEV